MAFVVFKPLSVTILDALNGWATISDTIVGTLKGPILAALTLKLMWHGFSAIRGATGRLVLVDAVFASLRIVLVWWAALTAGSYTANVQDFLLGLRDGLTSLFVPAAVDSYSSIDTMMTKATDALTTIFSWGFDHITLFPKVDVTGVVAILAGLVMVTCMAIFGLVACVNMLFVDLSLAFLLAVGPLFVACFAFQSTARFFDSWLGTVLKFVFMSALVAAIAGMAIKIMNGYADALAADVDTMDFITTTFAALGASGVLILFAVFAPALAASIANGIAVNAMSLSKASGPVGAAMAAVGSAGRSMAGAGAGVTANTAGYLAGKAASSAPGQAMAASAPAQSVMSWWVTAETAASVASGSMSEAYRAGRGSSISAGDSSAPAASSRPLSSPAGSRSLPGVSPSQSRAANDMRLAG
jgi:type IV secretion system protein VirB6